tara:strand:- start:354 stop:980 length:627 start_codon:yes stop_codon:yes gene_type:complete
MIAIIAFSPLLLIIIIVLRLTGEGEVFFEQERIGRYGKPFKLLKFATMLANSPNIGTGEITIKNDPRVLPVGVFLRKSKINELPQLWNIINGDMSIVGPRPMVKNTYANYSLETKNFIDMIRPGLTGIGSIFFRNEELYLANRQDPMNFYIRIIIPYKSELEIWFVKNNSLALYFKIIFITAWIVIFSKSNLAEQLLRGIPSKPDELL